jgi:hypothetical protein
MNTKLILDYVDRFPSVQFLGLGQMIATVLFLFVAKKMRIVSFPDLARDTFRKVCFIFSFKTGF